MYLLQLFQDSQIIPLAVFNSLEEGRESVSVIPGYYTESLEGYVEDYLDVTKLPAYYEWVYQGNTLPLSHWMFATNDPVYLDWRPIANLSLSNQGLIEGAMNVDGYSVDFQDAKAYITDRDRAYQAFSEQLASYGIETRLTHKGSEDGSMIQYRPEGASEWMYVTHLDPMFMSEDLEALVSEVLQEAGMEG